MTEPEIAYDSRGHPYTVLDRETALRYARAAEDRYACTDLPSPDLEAGPCGECHQEAHSRWQHGQEQLCRQCRRSRDRAAIERPDQPLDMSIRLPRFHGLCQRCIHDQPEPLTLVKDLFLCDQHARNRQRALTRETRRKQAA